MRRFEPLPLFLMSFIFPCSFHRGQCQEVDRAPDARPEMVSMSGPASASSGAVVAQEGNSRASASPAGPAASHPSAMTVGNNGKQAAPGAGGPGASRRPGPNASNAEVQMHTEESPNHIVYRKVHLFLYFLLPISAI